ncbi:hypothetical protein [Photobacterium frigidiphilum]|nr:hypothetical protein [Photobacterium frigidiphilum]
MDIKDFKNNANTMALLESFYIAYMSISKEIINGFDGNFFGTLFGELGI